jgi:hypothetical protein
VFEDNPFVGGVMDMSDYKTIGVIGNREFKKTNMTLQEYADKASYVRRQREISQKFGTDEKRYITSGGKKRGDKEDEDIYRERINKWANDQALSAAWLEQSAGSEQYGVNTTPQGPVVVDGDGEVQPNLWVGTDNKTVCKVCPNKKQKRDPGVSSLLPRPSWWVDSVVS